jgi:hypothetical protein
MFFSTLLKVVTRLPHVAMPRLLAVAGVALLSVTIIGIPLAIRQAVRWTFVEQAVLLDGEPGWRALQRSSAAVTADWWWCVGASVSLGLVGLGAAPALGIVLLLGARELPLIWVNVISSAVYVALAPYVAICLALVYFSLRERQAEK